MEANKYPSWRYHAEKAPRLVQDPAEDAALGEGWSDKPFPPKPAPVVETPAADDAAQEMSRLLHVYQALDAEHSELVAEYAKLKQAYADLLDEHGRLKVEYAIATAKPGEKPAEKKPEQPAAPIVPPETPPEAPAAPLPDSPPVVQTSSPAGDLRFAGKQRKH